MLGSTAFTTMCLVQPALAAEAASGQSSPASVAPPTVGVPSGTRLNTTGRTILLTVPTKDSGRYIGDMPLSIGADDSLSFPTDRALQLLGQVLAPDVLQTLRGAFAGRANIGPADFVNSGIKVEYNSQTLELNFVIPVEKRASSKLSVSPLDRTMIGTVVKPAGFSAYLNIRGSLDLSEDGPSTGFGNPVFLLDGAARLGDVVAESDAIWIPGNSDTDFQRLGSRLVYDDLKSLVRISLGDLETQGRGLQSSPQIAGISFVRSYSQLNPSQVIRPRGDQSFRLERPSTVEILVNGQQVRRLQLAPGNYNLRDFPFAQGANDIRVNVLDDTGRTESLHFNIFLDQTQLAKGLTEFGVYAGVLAPLELSGPHYTDDLAFSGFVRTGLSDYVTVGANFQADKNIQMGGVEAVFGTAIGTFGVNASFSHAKGVGDGSAFQATFQRLFQHRDGQSDAFNLFVERRSEKFTPVVSLPNLPFFLPNNPYEFEVGGGYTHAFSRDFYAGVDARYSKGRTFVLTGKVPDVQNYRLNAGWRISDRATLTAEGRYQEDTRGKEWSGFFTLTVRLGQYSSVRTEYDTRDNRMRASYQTLKGSGVGSYNVTADFERNDFGGDIGVNANYFTNRAELGFSHFGTFSDGFGTSYTQRSTFRLGTSIAIADDTVSIGRPIYDAFAIVKPHKSLKDADVLIEPTPFGFTANTGALGVGTMPGLSAYSERTLPIDVRNAPPGTDIGQGSFKLFPPYRGGYLLTVGSDYNVTALGKMIDIDGEPVALVSGTATELAHPDHEAITVFTNREGNFGITGLAPGKWRLEMLDDKKSVFIVTIPEDGVGVVRLGQISAEKDR